MEGDGSIDRHLPSALPRQPLDGTGGGGRTLHHAHVAGLGIGCERWIAPRHSLAAGVVHQSVGFEESVRNRRLEDGDACDGGREKA